MKGGVRKRYGSWYYYFDLGIVDGKRKKIERKAVGAETKSQAEKLLRKALEDYENTGIIFEPSETSLHDYLQFWLNEYVLINLKHNTQENYKGIIKNHINPAIGRAKLKSLTPELLQKFINDKYREGLSRKTLSIFHTVLQNALKQAVYPYKLINENPMQYVKLPRKENKKTTEADLKILPMSSIRKINDFLDPSNSFYIPFHIGLNTGMRVSEVCALTWECVDLNGGTISVDKILVNVNREWVFGTPKTASSYRTIHIGATLIKILKEHRIRQKENKLKYGEFYHVSNFVCTKENGEPVTPASCKWSGRNIRVKLGIDFNFHSLRHTHATLLLEQGAPIKDIQSRLGHSRSGITLDTYSHLTDKMKNETVDIFERLMNDVR
ncbi:site-specific integrase [Paenibacillus larvae]|uniref:Integrase n=9 Tax=Fernvirus TaxID=2843380 RepID=A0A2I7SCV1_9CAUD|nr:site-specific integrase [Paenibacillus larvae]YP_009203234.1 integrase [Paenibacillus phage Fern]YP_009593441.1 integrase [Paenibacillus phage Willow]YP_009836295.1 integrase [Paenibacillus phage BN12]YP_009836442.1 integrase [Paenibacillus phage Pagassa]YP_009836512.1 integrase [Paenibacillus phage Tadhana]YP_009838729.1 integrase [Paenibacillus phage Kawika]YP_009838800.1 integrase [Paenibacillus phage Lucielle]AXF39588.1 site-specific integrase [Paenibacillus phage Honeybear]AXF40469